MGPLFRGASKRDRKADLRRNEAEEEKPLFEGDHSGDFAFLGAPVGQLPPLPFLSSPELEILFSALAQGGREARLIGGCVRDAVLGLAPNDIDLATPEPPERVLAFLENAGLRAIPTGFSHGTVSAIVNEQRFEITSLRVDEETDGRRARVLFTDDWEKDAARRDFTFNAMSATKDGLVYDYYNGLSDLAHGRVRFIGRAEDRIKEDALRILRFFRFFARFGRPPLNMEALEAIKRRAGDISSLSAERIRSEMMRILECDGPASILLLMQSEKALEHVLPEAQDFGPLRQLTFLEQKGLVRETLKPAPLRRLASLLPPDPSCAASVSERWKLSKKDAKRLYLLLAESRAPQMDKKRLNDLLHRFGADFVRDFLLVLWARERADHDRPAHGETALWIDRLDRVDGWAAPAFPLSGDDAIALGAAPGPKLGALLDALRQEWIDGDFQPDREALLERARLLLLG